jgi:hypothetical protein
MAYRAGHDLPPDGLVGVAVYANLGVTVLVMRRAWHAVPDNDNTTRSGACES